MSDKLMNFLSRKGNESHIKNYYFDDEEDELNLQIYYDEKKIDDNVFNKKNENKYFMEKLDDNINETGRETKLKEITEEGFPSNKEEDELPLITLNFISICQCCKKKFDSQNNLPYLFSCGHFFCINCIKQYFTDKIGIVCPSDGLVAKSINELKRLKNLIIDSKKKNVKNIKSYERIYSLNSNKKINNNYLNNYCQIHKYQKLSHVIKETNEIICVHCAFEKLKSNPNIEIKEMKEKISEYNENLQIIINNCQKNIELIQHTLELIEKNKENEEKKMNIFYNNIIKFIETQKKERKEQIENINKENKQDLEQKLLIFNEIVEQGEDLKKLLEKEYDDNQNYAKILNYYHKILKLIKSNNDDNINNKLKYIKFSNENEKNTKEYLSKVSNLNIIYRIIKYIKNGKVFLNDNKKIFKFKKIENNRENSNNSSFNYNKSFINTKRISTNIKNISSDNTYENKINNNKKEIFVNKNSSMNIKEINYFEEPLSYNFSKINNYKTEINNSTKNSNTINKTSFLKNQYEGNIPNKKYLRGNKSNTNNNLLDNYFELKNKEKSMSLNNYDNYNRVEVDSQKNIQSFNNLNILNNFYDLENSKKGPFNKNKKKINNINFAF